MFAHAMFLDEMVDDTPIFDEMMRELAEQHRQRFSVSIRETVDATKKAFDEMIEPINYAADAIKDLSETSAPVHDPRKNQALLHKKAVARRKKRKRGGHK